MPVPERAQRFEAQTSLERSGGCKSGEGETLSFKNVFPFPKVSIAFFAYPLVQKCLQNGGFFRVAGGAEAGIGKALAELHGGAGRAG